MGVNALTPGIFRAHGVNRVKVINIGIEEKSHVQSNKFAAMRFDELITSIKCIFYLIPQNRFVLVIRDRLISSNQV